MNKRQPAIKFNKHHLYTPERAPLTSLLVIFLPVTDVLLTQLVSVWQNLPHYSHQHMMIWQFLTDAPAVRARMIPNPFEPRRLMWLSKQENPDQQSQCLSWRLRPQTATCLLDSRWNLWSNNPLQCFQLGLSTNKCWQCAFLQNHRFTFLCNFTLCQQWLCSNWVYAQKLHDSGLERWCFGLKYVWTHVFFFAANFPKDVSKIRSFIVTNKAGKCTDVISSSFVLMLW